MHGSWTVGRETLGGMNPGRLTGIRFFLPITLDGVNDVLLTDPSTP